MSLSYGGSARRIEARRPFSLKSVPQLRMKFETLGFKMASDPTMMTNRVPSRWTRTKVSSKCHLVSNH